MGKITNILNWLKKEILNTITINLQIFPKQYIYMYVITLWIVLLMLELVTETRLISFCIILLIIATYKILHKQVKKINIKDKHTPILLKIYKYKNPLIILIIELELKMSYLIYKLSKKKIKLIYLNLIYNLTALNGIKIVLTKFYQILIDWKKYTIYEIIFKRIYGMVLSVLIFTNIIQLVLSILKIISINWLIWIYIFLIIISYVMNTSSIDTIEYLRKESNFIWLIIKKHEKIINIENQDLKTLLGLLNVNIKDILNYENYFKYLLLSWEENTKINYNKPSYMYCYEIQNILFDTEYIFDLKAKLKKIKMI